MAEPSVFGARLKRLRQERGLTQDELAELAGCATQTIRKIEGGQRRPSYQMAERLALVLELAPEQRAAWMRAARDSAEQQPATPSADGGAARLLPDSLPAYLTPFVGREREQADLGRLLGAPGCRLITLLGPGGVGKTRLAVETARDTALFPDGVAFVSLAPVAAPTALVAAIGAALGVAFAGPAELEAQLETHLAEKAALLVLDNLEHLLDDDGLTLGLLARLLAHAPGVTLLVTTRERLGLPGEWVVELEGLAAPPAGPARPGDYPALTLFMEHARRARQSFSLDPAGARAVARICRLVGGMPLAIELAAAWVRVLTPEEIGAELARDLDALRLAHGAAPARHHSLRAVVDHSWRLLSEDERAALRRLSVLQGGFSREAAARVAGASLPQLAALADQSLLRRAAGGRYELHELIRQYAACRLAEDPAEREAAHDRHAAYFAALCAAREAPLKGAAMAATLAELGAEIDNLRAAWRWALDAGRFDYVCSAAETAHWFFEFRGWYQEGAAAFLQAARALRPLAGPGDEGRGRMLGHLLAHHGYFAARLGRLDQARASLAESLDLLRGAGDPAPRSHALMYSGMVAFQMGDYPAARRDLGAALAIGGAAGDVWTTAFCQAWGSMVAHAQGQLDEAEALLRASLAAYRALGNPRAIAFCITFGSLTLVARGSYREAQELLRESLLLSQPTGDAWGMALALHHLGLVALRQGDAEEAAYLFREALALLRTTGNRWEGARALSDLGAALLDLDDPGAAARAFAEALELALEARAAPEALKALAGAAACLQREGRPAAALGIAARILADPAARSDTRAQVAALAEALRPALGSAEAAAAEAAARDLPLDELLLAAEEVAA